MAIYGDRVRAARILRRMPSGELAAALGKAPAGMTRLEASVIESEDAQLLAALSGVLRFPEQFFTMQPPPPLSDGQLLFRAPKSTTKREKSYLAELARLVGEFLQWVQDKHPLPPVRLPTFGSDTPPAAAAMEVRSAIGCEEGPIPFLTHPIERMGVVVAVRSRTATPEILEQDNAGAAWSSSADERHLGYSTWTGEFRERPVIFMRSIDSWERTRWTLAHEVGHLCLHYRGVDANSEEQANRFANAFIAPADLIRPDIPKVVTLSSLVDLKMRWGISISALIRHLHQSGFITDTRKDTLQKQLYTRKNPETGRTYGVDEPGWKAQTPERPRMLAEWLERTVGSANPNAVASLSGAWPADVLGGFLTEQRRRGPVRGSSTSQRSQRPVHADAESRSSGQVIDLAARRAASS